MIQAFLQLNRQRLRFLVIVFAGVPSFLLLAALLIARTEVYRPLGEVMRAVFLFALGLFLLMIVALLIDGIADLRKRRKVMSGENWNRFFKKFGFEDSTMDVGRFRFIQEAKKGKIEGFETIAFVSLKEKAMHFLFLARDEQNGLAKYDHECNLHFQLNNLQMGDEEVEIAVLDFIQEMNKAGIRASGRVSHRLVKKK